MLRSYESTSLYHTTYMLQRCVRTETWVCASQSSHSNTPLTFEQFPVCTMYQRSKNKYNNVLSGELHFLTRLNATKNKPIFTDFMHLLFLHNKVEHAFISLLILIKKCGYNIPST